MIRDSFNLPTARSWRDIPQPIVPRAMSKEGRWRFAMSGVRLVAVSAVIGVCGWGVWLVSASIRENPREMPAAAKAIPMKRPELRTDGVLDVAWLEQTLALPKNASLMELDLRKLRERLLADEQVINANLTRHFPDRLVVQISERTPVARLRAQWLGQQRELLVARDGVVYSGDGYDRALLDSLPYLGGLTLAPDGAHFRPIEGMAVVAELLGKAHVEADHLYRNWQVVSLQRLQSDGRIEILTKDGAQRIFFTTRDDFFRQLVKLSYINDKLAANAPGVPATIDLTLGQDVPVMVSVPTPEPAGSSTRQVAGERRAAPATRQAGAAASRSAPHSESALFLLSHDQPRKTKREL